ncbi:MAG: radical SAM protein [Candidatus Aenigmatarchaeota archaeon]
MNNVSNIRLRSGFATNSSSSHSIVFFSDEVFYKNLDQKSPFSDLSYNKISDIYYPNTNFILKNKNLIKIYILTQLAHSVFQIVKNNELVYKIVKDITGEDLESLIGKEFIIEENNSSNSDKDHLYDYDDELENHQGNYPSIDHDNIWSLFENLISDNNEFISIFIKKMLRVVDEKNVALINHYNEYLLKNNTAKKFNIEKEEDLKKVIDVERTEKLKEILEVLSEDYRLSTKKCNKVKVKYDNNYFIFFNKHTGTKVRFSFENNINYEKSNTPELVDIKITDYCPFNCKFCYMESTKNGKHADPKLVKEIFDLLADLDVFEVAIGGGEPTLHPNIEEIIEYGCSKNIAINLTTYNPKIFRNKKILEMFVERKISSIGFSINKVEDVDKMLEMIETVEDYISEDINERFFYIKDYLVAHIVLGAHNYETFYKMVEKCLENDIRILFLGPKHVGFGKTYKFYDLGKQMQYIFLRYDNSKYNGISCVKIKLFSIDTKFVQLAHIEEMKKYFDIRKIDSKLIAAEEGKFSMYIDCVDKLMAPSSYCEKEDMDKLELDKEKFLEVWRRY